MSCVVERFWPSDFPIMTIRIEKRFHALGRVIFERQGRRAPPSPLGDTVGEEAFLERVLIPCRLFQSSPGWLHTAEHEFRC
jgi:hypothetical protein